VINLKRAVALLLQASAMHSEFLQWLAEVRP
jgi:hypothetical protein